MTAPVDFYRQLGRRMAALRRAVGLSQERLGERAQVGASYVAHIEIGSRKPTIDVLRRIAEAVDVPLWRLLTDDRFTTDEKEWDAAARELGKRVHGLGHRDLQALTHIATRLQTVGATPEVQALPPGTRVRSTSGPMAARAAESEGPSWKPPSPRTRSRRSR